MDGNCLEPGPMAKPSDLILPIWLKGLNLGHGKWTHSARGPEPGLSTVGRSAYRGNANYLPPANAGINGLMAANTNTKQGSTKTNCFNSTILRSSCVARVLRANFERRRHIERLSNGACAIATFQFHHQSRQTALFKLKYFFVMFPSARVLSSAERERASSRVVCDSKHLNQHASTQPHTFARLFLLRV